MAAYFDSAGKQLKGDKLKKYLKALDKAQKAGTQYTGPKYYTQQEVEAMYNGAPLSTIQQLGKYRALLTELPAQYTAQTDAQLRAAAAAKVEGDYQAAKTTAGNTYQNNLLALQNQLKALEQPYDAQVSAAQRATSQNIDTLTGTMLSRGLGRSSYAGALQGAALNAGSSMVNSILGEKTTKTNEVNSQIGQLGTNYNNTLAALDTAKASQIDTTYNALKAEDQANQLNYSNARLGDIQALMSLVKKKVSNTTTYTPSSNQNTGANNSNNSSNQSNGRTLQDLANQLLG